MITELSVRVRGCKLLRDSVTLIVEGFAELLENGADPKELAAALRADLVGRTPERPGYITLAESITISTTHLPVDPLDPLVEPVREALELPMIDRRAHVESLRLAIAPERLEIAAVVADLRDEVASRDKERDAARADAVENGRSAQQFAAQLMAATAALNEANAAIDAANAAIAAKVSLLDSAKTEVEIKDATIKAKDAQVQAMSAKLDATNAIISTKDVQLETMNAKLTATTTQLSDATAKLNTTTTQLTDTTAKLAAATTTKTITK